MQSRKPKLMRLNACAYLLLTLALLATSRAAQADLLLESQAGQNAAPSWGSTLQLRVGTIKGTRNRSTHDDRVRRYHGAVGLALRYRFLYVVPELEFHYVDIETSGL